MNRKQGFWGLAIAIVAVSFIVGCSSSGTNLESLFPLNGFPPPKFAFVVADSNVNAYTVNATTGAWTPVAGSPFDTLACPDIAAADPTGKFLFVPDACNDDIAVYSINPTTGALAAVPGSPFLSGTDNFNVFYALVDPTGKFLFVTEDGFSGVTLVYNIAANGALTAVSGSPFTAGNGPEGIVIHPSGKFLFVPNSDDGTITTFNVAANGSLTVASTFDAGVSSSPAFPAIDPAGKFLFVTEAENNGVLAFTINATTGALTAVSGSPFTTGPNPQGIAVTPDGKYLYVGDAGDGATPPGDFRGFSINATTGALTTIPGSPFTAGPNPKRVATDPSNKFVYVANDDSDNVSGFLINPANGALTPIPGSPFATSAGPENIVITHQ